MKTLVKVYKRDGSVENYEPEKITNAIFKAVVACGGNDRARAEELSKEVQTYLETEVSGNAPK